MHLVVLRWKLLEIECLWRRFALAQFCFSTLIKHWSASAKRSGSVCYYCKFAIVEFDTNGDNISGIILDEK